MFHSHAPKVAVISQGPTLTFGSTDPPFFYWPGDFVIIQCTFPKKKRYIRIYNYISL